MQNLKPFLKSITKTDPATTVVASAMFTVCALAMILTWGLLAVAAIVLTARETPIMVRVTDIERPLGVIPLDASSGRYSRGHAGHFVQYAGKPLLLTEMELQAQRDRKLLSALNYAGEVQTAKSKMKEQRDRVRAEIMRSLKARRYGTEPTMREVFKQEFDELIFADLVNVTAAEAESLAKLPGVVAVLPNNVKHATVMQSTAFIGASDVWTLDASGRPCAESGQPCLDGAGVRVAVIDTGVDYTRPMFGSCTRDQFLSRQCAKVVGGDDFGVCDSLWENGQDHTIFCCDQFDARWNCLHDPTRTDDHDPMDEQGHGSHVAGIAVGRDVGNGISGVAPGAPLLAYKVFNSVEINIDAWTINALTAAVRQGARVINISLGGYGDPDDMISRAVDNTVAAGAVVVISAGNDGPGSAETDCRHGGDGSSNSICSPGTAASAITVGAVYKRDYQIPEIPGAQLMIGPDVNPLAGQIAYFSSRGPVRWNGREIFKPDVVAPGIFLCSSRLAGAVGRCYAMGVLINGLPPELNQKYNALDTQSPDYLNSQGTSQSSPMVAGTVALLLQKNPRLTPQEVKTLLMEHTVEKLRPGANHALGAGRVNVTAAVAAVPSLALAVSFRRGDADGRGSVDLTDAIFLLQHLFQQGPTPSCQDAADANDDGSLDLSDPIRILFYLFTPDHPAPPNPGPTTFGPDPTADGLGCAQYPAP